MKKSDMDEVLEYLFHKADGRSGTIVSVLFRICISLGIETKKDFKTLIDTALETE